MTQPKYHTTPFATDKMPPGIPYIIGNEVAERFSFYGMRAILIVFMTQNLMGSNDQLDLMNDDQAKEWFHTFVAASYFFPIMGALLSDIFLGKYRTIILLSIVYCLGHLALAVDSTRRLVFEISGSDVRGAGISGGLFRAGWAESRSTSVSGSTTSGGTLPITRSRTT